MHNFLMKIRKMKEIFLPAFYQGSFSIADIYIRIILFLYPLFLTEDLVLRHFTSKTFLFGVLTLLTAVFSVIFSTKNDVFCRKHMRKEEFFLVLTAVFLAAKLADGILKKDMNYDMGVFLICVTVSYFILKFSSKEYVYYLRLLMFSALILYAGILKYYLFGTENVLSVKLMIKVPEAINSWLVLAVCMSSVLYCEEKEISWKRFYLLMSVVGYFVLGIHGDIAAICMSGFFVLLIPLLFLPTQTLVKKNLTLCFSFLVIVSSVPLLQYVNLFQLKGTFDLIYSVYMMLFVCFVSAFIGLYWERIPKERNPDTVIMRRFRRWYKGGVSALGCGMIGCLLIGTRMNDLPDKFGMKTLKAFGSSFLQSIDSNKSFFQLLLEDYGVVGCALWICLAVLFANRIVERWKTAEPVIKIYLTIAALFLVQTFFYRLQPVSTPAYVIILSLALSENNEKEKQYERQGE